MPKLTKKLKEELYSELGFQFSGIDEINYENIFKAIDLGEKFKEFAKFFELDETVYGDIIKKYVLHLILEESVNIVKAEIDLVREFPDEPLLDSSFGEILENVLNNVDFSQSEDFKHYFIETLKKEDNRLKDDKAILIEDFDEGSRESMPVTLYPFSERSNTLFRLYFMNYVNKKKPIKPRYWDKDTVPEILLEDLIIHYKQYTNLLKGFGREINPTRDLLEIERETNIFYLLKLISIISIERIEKLSKKDRKKYFKALSSITLIEDIPLKLYLAEQLINDKNESILLKSKVGYNLLFKQNFLYIPLLTMFLKEKINAPHGVLTVKSTEIDKDVARRLGILKKALYVYKILQSVQCYRVSDLEMDSLLRFNKNSYKYSSIFFELYKKTSKIKDIREKLSKEVTDDCFQFILKRKEALYDYLEYESFDFIKNGEKLYLE
ncbi:hypothetical protein [Niallia sp.]|uniref:hypothetical protein n=1 Tax=Niallia sp. TaxID=2837523 RepID=UPI0028A26803|nr:hypothetical protein [Niallia sp.]